MVRQVFRLTLTNSSAPPLAGSRAWPRSIRPIALAVLACCALAAAPARGQGFDDRFPDPVGTHQLVEWLGPLLATPEDAWTRTLEIHRRYLDQQRQLREQEIEAWISAGDRRAESPDEPSVNRDRERARRRLLDRIRALDDQLFDGIAAVVDASVVPVIDWLKVHRALETCECGLDVQTQEVSFSLLSYSEVAMEAPPLVWASPQAGTALAEYDRRILRWGREYLKAHRAWQEAGEAAQALADTAGAEPRAVAAPPAHLELGEDGTMRLRVEGLVTSLTLRRADEHRGSWTMPPEYAELMEFMRAQRIEIVEQLGDDGEWEEADDAEESAEADAAWRAHGRALAYMGRRMHGQIESSLDARTRLLFRLRIMRQVVNLHDPASQDGGRRERGGAPSLRRHLRDMQELLERAVDARSPVPIDVAAVEAACAAHWQAVAGIADELLGISRTRSDVLFTRGEQWEGGDNDPTERRRLALVRQWEPLAAEAVEALRTIAQQGEALHRATEQRAGRPERPDDPGGPAEHLKRRLRPFRDPREGPDEGGDAAAGEFDERRFHRRMSEILPGPITSARIVETLGWEDAPAQPAAHPVDDHAAHRADEPADGRPPSPVAAPGPDLLGDRAALREVIATLRSEVLSRAWVDLEPLLLIEDDERRERGLSPMTNAEKVSTLLAIRDIVRDAEARLVGEVAAIVPTEADRLRLRLLLHSVRFQRNHWPWDDVPGLDSPALRPIDLAALVLDEIRELDDEAAIGVIAAAFFDRSESLLGAATSTGEAFIAVGRLLLERMDGGQDERHARRMAAAQENFAAGTLAEVRLQWEAIETLLADLPPAHGMRLRRVALHAIAGKSLLDDESEAAGPDVRPVLEHASDPESMATMTELVEDARLRHLDRLLETYRAEAMVRGVMFPQSDERASPEQPRLARVRRRVKFELGEVNARTSLALASLIESGSPARAAFGAYGLVGARVGLAPLLVGIEWEPRDAGR